MSRRRVFAVVFLCAFFGGTKTVRAIGPDHGLTKTQAVYAKTGDARFAVRDDFDRVLRSLPPEDIIRDLFPKFAPTPEQEVRLRNNLQSRMTPALHRELLDQWLAAAKGSPLRAFLSEVLRARTLTWRDSAHAIDEALAKAPIDENNVKRALDTLLEKLPENFDARAVEAIEATSKKNDGPRKALEADLTAAFGKVGFDVQVEAPPPFQALRLLVTRQRALPGTPALRLVATSDTVTLQPVVTLDPAATLGHIHRLPTGTDIADTALPKSLAVALPIIADRAPDRSVRVGRYFPRPGELPTGGAVEALYAMFARQREEIASATGQRQR